MSFRLFPVLYRDITHFAIPSLFARKGNRFMVYKGGRQHQYVKVSRVFPGVWIEEGTPFFDFDSMFTRRSH